MLNHAKFLKEIAYAADRLMRDATLDETYALTLWRSLCSDPHFKNRAQQAEAPWPIPQWHGQLNERLLLDPLAHPYSVISVDGSQIYPDRHQGVSCFLINIGTVQLHYKAFQSTVKFESTPFLMDGDEAVVSTPPEIVNCRRSELELQAALELSRNMNGQNGQQKPPYVVLFDGSLIFWHLETHELEIKYRFLTSYIALLQQFYESRCLLAGYISFPKSKELVNILRLALWLEGHETSSVDYLIDTAIAGFFLEPSMRSGLFMSTSAITAHYPDHLKPYFLYCNTGYEIARIELPAWIAQNPEDTTTIVRIVLDQSAKGRGYPVCLAEAHEQAVIKGPDRDFFYHVLQKLSIEHKQAYKISQKSLKKRGIGI